MIFILFHYDYFMSLHTHMHSRSSTHIYHQKNDWAYLHLHPGSEQDHFLNAVIVAVAVAVVVNNFILFK